MTAFLSTLSIRCFLGVVCSLIFFSFLGVFSIEIKTSRVSNIWNINPKWPNKNWKNVLKVRLIILLGSQLTFINLTAGNFQGFFRVFLFSYVIMEHLNCLRWQLPLCLLGLICSLFIQTCLTKNNFPKFLLSSSKLVHKVCHFTFLLHCVNRKFSISFKLINWFIKLTYLKLHHKN